MVDYFFNNVKRKMNIVIATKNKGKIKEIKDFFKQENILPGIKLLTSIDFKDMPDIEEGSSSFFKNAKLKAQKTAEFTGCIAIADDSGLTVGTLNGAPGVISSRYAGFNASDSDNRKKLLEELKLYNEPQKRSAAFVCKMVLWDPQAGMLKHTSGICRGSIGFIEKGTNGFGYDSIFIPEGRSQTMAEISDIEKNMISHRGKALKKMSDYIKKTFC
ncbi:MAG: RdgB/HAM1 family non-canonical purine NTP pyrophosphatase [Actinobacteria bacterium]|nr:RdgB/HAM1 family non-canonical purine NTP pyrophosphatase [Actinomycetota bacterium]